MIATRIEPNGVGHNSCLCNISGQTMSSGQYPSLVYDRTTAEVTVGLTKRNLPRYKTQSCVRTTYDSVQSTFIFYFYFGRDCGSCETTVRRAYDRIFVRLNIYLWYLKSTLPEQAATRARAIKAKRYMFKMYCDVAYLNVAVFIGRLWSNYR